MATAVTALRRVVESVRQPYPVVPQIFVLLAIVPFYIFIGEFIQGRPVHFPATRLDDLIPLIPVWSLIYGALYAFLIVVPAFVVREREQVRRMFSAYITVWLAAYLCFILYPTKAPRPPALVGGGFTLWGLRFLYGADPPYNCLPSIHVAHSFVSAFACHATHRGVGVFAFICAALVALSTLFTKQHYVLDLAGGILLASLSYAFFAWRYPRATAKEHDRSLAPVMAACVFAVAASGIGIAWIVYLFKAN